MYTNIRQTNKIICDTRPLIKTRKFSTLHIEIFEQLLISGKSNRDLNLQFGYTEKSHSVIDHSRKVMYKLLSFENLGKSEYRNRVIHPKKYREWWSDLLKRHKDKIAAIAIEPEYYE